MLAMQIEDLSLIPQPKLKSWGILVLKKLEKKKNLDLMSLAMSANPRPMRDPSSEKTVGGS